jgi:hypothetical protein
MAASTDQFIRTLTANHRVIVLGGLAVIAHGLSRSTYDGDIWLDPMTDAEAWSETLLTCCRKFDSLTIHQLPGWTEVSSSDLPNVVHDTGLVRILGLDCPLDVFRKPNETEIDHFDQIYARGHLAKDGTILPDPLDLIQSKLDTGRDKDLTDILFLESLVRADYKKRLPIATLEEATAMLDRFSEWQVLQAALENPSVEVKALAHQHLREFAEAGDPFSQAILEGREIP